MLDLAELRALREHDLHWDMPDSDTTDGVALPSTDLPATAYSQDDGGFDNTSLPSDAAWQVPQAANWFHPTGFLDADGVDLSPLSAAARPADASTFYLVSSDPSPGAVNAHRVGAYFDMAFNRNVMADSGYVTFHYADGGGVAARYSINDHAHVIFDGSEVNITVSKELARYAHLYLTIDSTAIEDSAGDHFTGFTTPTAFAFTTAPTYYVIGQTTTVAPNQTINMHYTDGQTIIGFKMVETISHEPNLTNDGTIEIYSNSTGLGTVIGVYSGQGGNYEQSLFWNKAGAQFIVDAPNETNGVFGFFAAEASPDIRNDGLIDVRGNVFATGVYTTDSSKYVINTGTMYIHGGHYANGVAGKNGVYFTNTGHIDVTTPGTAFGVEAHTFENSGYIIANGDTGGATAVFAVGNVFDNSGTIDAVSADNGSVAVAVSPFFGGISVLTNSGHIQGEYAFLATQYSMPESNYSIDIVNTASGVIDGDIHLVIGVVSNPLGDQVHNAGTINGNVTFGTANDTFDGVGGTLNGNVDGGDGNDVINAGAGNHTLSGGAGDDLITGGPGADAINGGDGNDTVDYSAASSGVEVNLSSTSPQAIGGGEGTDSFISVENLIGSSFADHLVGNTADNVFTPGSGNDIVSGGAGNDTVDFSAATSALTVNLSLTGAQTIGGGEGNDKLVSIENIIGSNFDDTLTGNSSDNVLTGGAGNDYLDGGAGSDTADYFNAGSGVTVDLNISTAQNTGGGGTDTLVSIENLIGSQFDDTLIGTPGDNSLSGGDGNDFLDPGTGNDVLDGGNGIDTVTFARATGGITVDLTIAGPQVIGGGMGTDTLTSIENVIGSAFDDVLTASNDGFGSVLNGGVGNDVLIGGSGNDTLIAGSGTDTLHGGDGSDTLEIAANDLDASDIIDGGAGVDTLVFTAPGTVMASAEVGIALQPTGFSTIESVQLANGTNYFQVGTELAYFKNGNLDVIPIVGGTGNDTIDASLLDSNRVVAMGGGDGNDTLIGGAGNDTLSGDAGDDLLQDVSGTNILNGGDGNDTITFATATGGVTLDLASTARQVVGAGTGSRDTITSIENIDGSSFDDSLVGSRSDNVFDLSQGGNDSAAGGAGNDTFILGGTGTDTLNGDTGYDTASYANATASVTVSLAVNGTQNTGGAGSDTLISIENLTGSNFDDSLIGSSGANVLSGGAGNDVLDLSAGGNDIALGGDGDDTIVFGATLTAADKIDGGAGNDTVKLDGDYSTNITFRSTTLANVETMALAAGHSYSFTTNDANVTAGATLTVDGSQLGASNDLVFNGSHETDGSFVLEGGVGDDVLDGGAGNDVIMGGLGADHLTGGAGVDRYVYSSVADSTGSSFDTITGFTGGSDLLDLPVTVAARDHTVEVGSLSAATFDSDLAADIGAGQLAAGHAVLFVAASGTYAGDTFLIVDANGVAGYQAGQDFVFLLDHAAHLSSLGASSFV